MNSSLKRLPDWPERLSRYVEANANRVFRWGTFDCAQFANGAVEAMTGQAVARCNCYTDSKEAREIMGCSIPRFVSRIARQQGWRKIKPAAAMRGDVVIAKQSNRLTVAVAMGKFCLSPGIHHLMKLPLTEVRLAWRI